jgi:hypothetical protein
MFKYQIGDICKYSDKLESFLFKITNRDKDGYDIKIIKILDSINGIEHYSVGDTSWFGNDIEYIEDSELVLKQKIKRCLEL